MSDDVMPAVKALKALDIEHLLLPILFQIVVIILVARVFATLFRKIGQPGVVGEIFAGMILGPSLLGALAPDVFVAIFKPALGDMPQALADVFLPKIFSVLAQLGLIFLLFLIGLEFDFSHLKTHARSAGLISIAGIALPFVLGIGLAQIVHSQMEPIEGKGIVDKWGFTLFMGVAMSITAIPILGRMMMEMGITRSRVGVIVITAAAIDDAAGWILLATIAAVVSSQFDVLKTLLMVGETVAFGAFMYFVARPLLIRAIRASMKTNDGDISVSALAVVIAVLFASAIATGLIGIFAIFGAFILGAVLSDQHEFREKINAKLRDVVTAFFLPIFFVNTGLRTDITAISGDLWMVAVAVTGAAILGKFGGCSLAARLSGFSARESTIIGVMMNTRALMELIVINVGYELGVIPKSMFAMLVIMALITTIVTTPILMRFMRGTELEPLIRSSGFLSPRELAKVRA